MEVASCCTCKKKFSEEMDFARAYSNYRGKWILHVFVFISSYNKTSEKNTSLLKMAGMTIAERNRAIGRLQAGESQGRYV